MPSSSSAGTSSRSAGGRRDPEGATAVSSHERGGPGRRHPTTATRAPTWAFMTVDDHRRAAQDVAEPRPTHARSFAVRYVRPVPTSTAERLDEHGERRRWRTGRADRRRGAGPGGRRGDGVRPDAVARAQVPAGRSRRAEPHAHRGSRPTSWPGTATRPSGSRRCSTSSARRTCATGVRAWGSRRSSGRAGGCSPGRSGRRRWSGRGSRGWPTSGCGSSGGRAGRAGPTTGCG